MKYFLIFTVYLHIIFSQPNTAFGQLPNHKTTKLNSLTEIDSLYNLAKKHNKNKEVSKAIDL